MRAAIVADLHPQHLVEDAHLDVGDDRVADPRHDDLLAIGRKTLDRIDYDDRRRDFPHRGQVAADEDLIDDPPDDPRRQRRRERDHAHHRECEQIALPMLDALVEQEPTQERVRGRVEKGAHALAGVPPYRQCFSPSRPPILGPRCRSPAPNRAAPSISSAAALWKSAAGATDQAFFPPPAASRAAA